MGLAGIGRTYPQNGRMLYRSSFSPWRTRIMGFLATRLPSMRRLLHRFLALIQKDLAFYWPSKRHKAGMGTPVKPVTLNGSI